MPEQLKSAFPDKRNFYFVEVYYPTTKHYPETKHSPRFSTVIYQKKRVELADIVKVMFYKNIPFFLTVNGDVYLAASNMNLQAFFGEREKRPEIIERVDAPPLDIWEQPLEVEQDTDD